jgi:lysophospholipid acyltransferase (LPLAT)-like uncharacterized protein
MNGLRLKQALIAKTGGALLDALMATTRYDRSGDEEHLRFTRADKPVIFVLWHSRLLPLSYGNRHLRPATLISQSADGEYIARIVESWGYTAIRGSSSRRGSAALREMVKHVRAGRSVAFTADGPRGPREKLKLGALLAAQLTGAPLIPSAAWTPSAWWLNSWDRFLVPKPFARIRVAFGPALHVERKLSPEELQARAEEVEQALGRVMASVERS